MRFYLNKLTVNGVKNISKPLEFLFCNKTITDNFENNDCNVKAIYGPNGCGKSAIVSALYIYKRLVEDNNRNGLSDGIFSRFVYDSINRTTKAMSIDIVFTVIDFPKDHKDHYFRHHIEISVEENIPSITLEEISILKGKSIADSNFKSIIRSEKGKIVSLLNKTNFEKEPIYLATLNLLSKHVFSCSVFNANDFLKNDEEIINAVLLTYRFASSLIVVLNDSDIHYEYIIDRSDSYIYQKNPLHEPAIISKNEREPFEFFTRNQDVIKIEDYPLYEDNVRKLKEFIKIFKPDLDDIIIDKKINGDRYHCDKIFCYGENKINVEFESTGIKKLVRLYSALKICANGGITFIDEMDSNLHDVYFTKLIEFFKNDSKGQLCFTTHNLEPINLLKDKAHSLDFVSDDSRVYSWKKDGNNSPMSKYVHGLIPYSPFNVESFFFDVLFDEDK